MEANPENRVEVLSERLATLEVANRRMKRFGATAVAVLGAALLMGQAEPEARTVEAERFVLRGSDGKVRGEFSSDVDGTARLEMRDGDRGIRALLKVAPDGAPRFTLYREGGNPVIQLVADPNGFSHVEVKNVGSAKVGVGADGSPFFIARDKRDNQLFRAP